IRWQTEIKPERIVDRVLSDQTVRLIDTGDIELPAVGVDGLAFQNHASQILGKRSTELVDSIVLRLIDKYRRGRGNNGAVESGSRINAMIIKARQVPTAFQRRNAQAVICIRELV